MKNYKSELVEVDNCCVFSADLKLSEPLGMITSDDWRVNIRFQPGEIYFDGGDRSESFKQFRKNTVEFITECHQESIQVWFTDVSGREDLHHPEFACIQVTPFLLKALMEHLRYAEFDKTSFEMQYIKETTKRIFHCDSIELVF